MSKLPFGRRRWLLKHATGFCGVGKMELVRGNQDHAECPRCGAFEDTTHVLTCKDPCTEIVYITALQKLDTHMRTIHTAPELRLTLLRRLKHWRKHGHLVPDLAPVPTTFGIREATIEQDNIGWYNFLLGRLSSRWTDSQQCYLESIKKCNSGRRWTIAILDKIWDISFWCLTYDKRTRRGLGRAKYLPAAPVADPSLREKAHFSFRRW
jgi:hypothetical protein